MSRTSQSRTSASLLVTMALFASAPAQAQTFLGGALEVDASRALAASNSGALMNAQGVLFAGNTGYGGYVRCFPTQPASSGSPLPPTVESRFGDSPTLAIPVIPGDWSTVRVLTLEGTAYREAPFDCTRGLGAARPVSVPADWDLDLRTMSPPLALPDGSILALAHGTGVGTERRYSALVRLVPSGSGWTGNVVLSTRSLRWLIDPAYLPDFDRLLYQQLRIESFARLPDGSIWLGIRQVSSSSVPGNWILRWRAEPDWDPARIELVADLGPGESADVRVAWIPALELVMIGRSWLTPPDEPRLLRVPAPVPELLPAHDGGLWAAPPFDGRVSRVEIQPLVRTASGDIDGDTRTYAEESAAGASDTRLDSDDDGVLDVLEVGVFSTDPADPASVPADVEAGPLPRFGVSTRVQTSDLAAAHAEGIYYAGWSSSPLLCADARCIDGTGAPVPRPLTLYQAAFTADASAWIEYQGTRGSGILFADGRRLEEHVSLLFAATGSLGASERGWVSPAGIYPFDTTLQDRREPHGGPDRILLGLDDATGHALVSVDDERGQVVLRVAPYGGAGNAEVLFRPEWLDLDRVETMQWLPEQRVYAVRHRQHVAGPARYALLDRAMRVVGTFDLPGASGYRFGRRFGSGYAMSGPGPEPSAGGFFSFFLAELVPDRGGLAPGDVVLWGRAEADGLWAYREDGTLVRLASRAELLPIADDAARARLEPPTGPDIVQIGIRDDAAELCLVDGDGGLYVLSLADGEPTAMSLLRADDALGCTYDDGALHWLTAVGIQLSVRDRDGAELTTALLRSPNRPRGLWAARDGAGARVWIVDTIAPSTDSTAEAACLRDGPEATIVPFDAAGIDVRDGVVAWIEATFRAYAGDDGSVLAASVDDFCAGRAAERAHRDERPEGDHDLFHDAYDAVTGAHRTEMTVPDAAFALRPDGRFLFANRTMIAPGARADRAGLLMQQAGAWLVRGPGAPIAAHEPWRRAAPGPLTLASAMRGVGAMAVVPGAVPEGWGRAFFDAPTGALPPGDGGIDADAGMQPDAESADGGSRPDAGPRDDEDLALCLCRAAGAGGRAGFFEGAVLLLLAALSSWRGARKARRHTRRRGG